MAVLENINLSFVDSKPKAKVFIPMYEPSEVTKCKKCGKVIAEPKELVRILEEEICRYVGCGFYERYFLLFS